MATTIAISEALKDALVDLAEDEDFANLNETIQYLIQHPQRDSESLSGYEKTLDEHAKVSEFTRSELKRIKNEEGFSDYEAVIRARGGYAKRDTGEEPIEVSSFG